MKSEVDHFPFILAEELGKTLGEIDAMPHAEYVQWKAWTVFKRSMQDHARTVAAWQ